MLRSDLDDSAFPDLEHSFFHDVVIDASESMNGDNFEIGSLEQTCGIQWEEISLISEIEKANSVSLRQTRWIQLKYWKRSPWKSGIEKANDVPLGKTRGIQWKEITLGSGTLSTMQPFFSQRTSHCLRLIPTRVFFAGYWTPPLSGFSVATFLGPPPDDFSLTTHFSSPSFFHWSPSIFSFAHWVFGSRTRHSEASHHDDDDSTHFAMFLRNPPFLPAIPCLLPFPPSYFVRIVSVASPATHPNPSAFAVSFLTPPSQCFSIPFFFRFFFCLILQFPSSCLPSTCLLPFFLSLIEPCRFIWARTIAASFKSAWLFSLTVSLPWKIQEAKLPSTIFPRSDRDLVFVVELSPLASDGPPLASSSPVDDLNSPPSLVACTVLVGQSRIKHRGRPQSAQLFFFRDWLLLPWLPVWHFPLKHSRYRVVGAGWCGFVVILTLTTKAKWSWLQADRNLC